MRKRIFQDSATQDKRLHPGFKHRTQCFPVGGRHHLLADGTGKAVGMIGLAQGGHHLSFHEFPTAVAACPIHPLVVQGAEILPVLYEEAPLCQVTAAHCGKTSSPLVSIC